MRHIILCAGLLWAVPAYADVTITLTDQEAQALVELMDAGVKVGGLAVAPAAVVIFDKLQRAVDAPLPAPKKE